MSETEGHRLFCLQMAILKITHISKNL